MAEDKYSKARKARGLRKTILSPDNEPDTLKRAREEVRNARGIETIKTGGKIMAGCGGKKMKKGGMAKKGMHMMADGTMMKDSEHKGMKKPTKKKMKSGGMVKRDGCATKGKTKGRMV